MRQWLLDRGSIYKATSARFPDPSTQRRLAARAAEIGKRWPEYPVTRTRAVLATLSERIEVSIDQIEIRLRPPQLSALVDGAATPIQGVTDEETEIVSVPIRLHRAGREIRVVIDRTDPERGPLIVPKASGRRECSSSFSAVRSRGCRPSRIASLVRLLSTGDFRAGK